MIGRFFPFGEPRVDRNDAPRAAGRRARLARPPQPRRCAGRAGAVERRAGDHHQPPLGARVPARRAAGRDAGTAGCGGAVGLDVVEFAALERGGDRGCRRTRRASRRWPATSSSFATRRCCWCGWRTWRGSMRSRRTRQQTVEGTQYLEEFIVGVVDAALAAQSALIAAESLGLGGVYIGAMRNLPEQVAEALKLPPHAFAVFGMSIGWPDPAKATDIKPRLSQARRAASGDLSYAAAELDDGGGIQRDDARVSKRAGDAAGRLDAAVHQPGEGCGGVARARPDARGAAESGIRIAVSGAPRVSLRGRSVIASAAKQSRRFHSRRVGRQAGGQLAMTLHSE